jgi:hypothetical protein
MKPAVWKNRLTGHWMFGRYGRVDPGPHNLDKTQGFRRWTDALGAANEYANEQRERWERTGVPM